MISAEKYFVVLVTAPDLASARDLGKRALNAKIVACANLIPGLESHYWWKGKIESSDEVLILFKTMRAHLGQLEKLVRAHHPYETPEIVVVPLKQGSARYLDWISESLNRDHGTRQSMKKAR